MTLNAYYAVFAPEEGSKVSVWFPDIFGCGTWGNSVEHAFAMAIDALEGHLTVMADDGDVIPAPSVYEAAWEKVRQDFEQEGMPVPKEVMLQLVPAPDVLEKPRRINVSLRPSVIAMLDRKADALGMSKSGLVAKAVEAYPAP